MYNHCRCGRSVSTAEVACAISHFGEIDLIMCDVLENVLCDSHQVLLCTATMPEAVAEAAAKWLKRPAPCRIEGAAAGAGGTAISRTVTQVHPPPTPAGNCNETAHVRGLVVFLANFGETSKPARRAVLAGGASVCRAQEAA